MRLLPWAVLAFLIVTFVRYRAVVLWTIEVTLLGIAIMLTAVGLALIARTVIRWNRLHRLEPEEPREKRPVRKAAGQDSEAMIGEAQHLARPDVSLAVDETGRIIQAS